MSAGRTRTAQVYGGAPVVDGLSFSIRTGARHALLVPTVPARRRRWRCCLGLIAADGGTIHLVGEPVPREAAACAHPRRRGAADRQP